METGSFQPLKLNAIVLAAGISNKYLEISEFKKKATEILCRAFTAIYDEPINGLIPNPTPEESTQNSQILLDCIRKKTRDPRLQDITSTHLQIGLESAIFPLIDLLYDEGQRLWFESEQNRVTPRQIDDDVELIVPEEDPRDADLKQFTIFEISAERQAVVEDLLEKARLKYQNKNLKTRPSSAPNRKKWNRDTRLLPPSSAVTLTPNTLTIMGRTVPMDGESEKISTLTGGEASEKERDNESTNSSVLHRFDAEIMQRHPKISCHACLDHTSGLKKIIEIFEMWSGSSMDAVSADPQSQSFKLFVQKLGKAKVQIIEVMKELGKVRTTARASDREMGVIRGELLKHVEKMHRRITDLAFSTGRNPDIVDLQKWMEYLTKKLDGFVTHKKQTQGLKRTISLLTTSLHAASNMVSDHKAISSDLQNKLDQAQVFVENSRKENEKLDQIKAELAESRGETDLLTNRIRLLTSHILNLEELENAIQKKESTLAEGEGKNGENEFVFVEEKEKEGKISSSSRCHPSALISMESVEAFRKRVRQKIELVKRKDYKIEEAHMKEAQLSEKLRRMENEAEKLKSEVQLLKQERDDLDKETRELREERTKLKKELLKSASAARQIEDLTEEVSRLTEEKREIIEKLTSQLNETTEELRETETSLEQTVYQLNETTRLKDDLNQENLRFKIENSDLQSQLRIANHKIEESDEELEKLKKQLEMVLDANVRMTETLNVLEDRLRTLEKSGGKSTSGRTFHAKNKLKLTQSMKRPDLLEAETPMPEPRFFAAYHALEPLDLVISIEHSNGDELSLSPRGGADSAEYLHYANLFLRTLARLIHDHSLSVRLGVLRIETTVEGRHLDDSPRVGAFEVQIAFRGPKPNDPVVFEILHSKISSSRWPSKSVLEKRLAAFISKASISSHRTQTAAFEGLATDGLSPYPVGEGPWHLTQLAHPGWNYDVLEMRHKKSKEADLNSSLSLITQAPGAVAGTSPQSPLPEAIELRETEGSTTESTVLPDSSSTLFSVISMTHPHACLPRADAQSDPSEIQALLEDKRRWLLQAPYNPSIFRIENVQWVFDARNNRLAELEIFSQDKEVCISGLSLHLLDQPVSAVGTERFRLNAVLKESPSASNYIEVKVRYYETTFKVRLASCILWSDFTPPVLYYHPNSLPECLDLLLLLLNESLANNLHKAWRKLEPGDSFVEREGRLWPQLTRGSFFHQTRSLVWQVEVRNVLGLFNESRASTGLSPGLVRHPRSGSLLDLQACYAEAALDWVLARCGGNLIDIYQLTHFS